MDNYNITAFIRPFILKQKVSVYHNDNCIETIKCNLDNIEDTIIGLVNHHNINQINIVGQNTIYGLKIKEHLLTNYASKQLNINIR